MTSEPEQTPTAYAPSRAAKRARATGQPHSSKRRMSSGRRVWYALLAVLARAVLWLLWRSCRIVAVKGAEHFDPRLRADNPAVIVYWHQMQLFGAWLLRRKARDGLPLAVLISPSVSGELPAMILRRWGVVPVRGSSTRSAAEALRDLYRVVATERRSLVITADGPKGPLHQFKPGAILLARTSKAPIVPMAFAASPCTFWKSWDRFIVPWPFSRVAIVVGEPWQGPSVFAMADLPRVTREMETRLAGLEAEARALLGL